MPLTRAFPLALAVFSLTSLAPRRAAAGDPASAQALFLDARRLMSEGSYAKACPKLEESQRLDPGIGTLFNLADCNEHIGRTASAWAGYLEVAALANASGQETRADAARARAARVAPRLATLLITVRSDAPAGMQLKRDGVVIGRGQWGRAVPVDPGEHRVAAVAPGKSAWSTVVNVPAEAAGIVVAVPPLADAARVASVPASTAAAKTADLADPPPPSASQPQPLSPPAADPPSNPGATQRTAAFVVGGLGVLGLGIGMGFGLHSKSERDASIAHCLGNACDAEGVALRQSAVSAGNTSTALFGVGAAALLGGALLWLTAPSGRDTTGKISASPMVSTSGGGFALQGAW